ncbi:MAG: HNH endonuclease [Actinobacteria bacterium]|nr:MAG: HNH endonuclease [Actinomycetota bacterium]
MAKTYREKLIDPRWQKKRLEVLELYGWACAWCGSESKGLHVHHSLYMRGRDPWDYPPDQLVALCFECHDLAEVKRNELLAAVSLMRPSELQEIIDFAKAKSWEQVQQDLADSTEADEHG